MTREEILRELGLKTGPLSPEDQRLLERLERNALRAKWKEYVYEVRRTTRERNEKLEK